MRALWLLALVACTKTSSIAITSIASVPRALPIPARDPGTVRVMSYNLNFGLAGDPEGAAAIAEASPDIVVLQESNAAWEDALVRDLPYPHHQFGAPSVGAPNAWPAGGMGVLSRFPIRSIEQLPSVNGPFFAWRIVIDTPHGAIQILDLHLRPPMSDGGSWVVGYFSTRGNRETEIEAHLARLDPKLPTIIAGDFNEEADGLAVKVADRLGYTDAIAQHRGATRTWEWPVGRFTLRFQLDHVLYDSRFVAPSAGIVEAGRSDHKPVWADLQRVEP